MAAAFPLHSPIAQTAKKTWSRPPISLDFTVPMFAASGLHVRFLKVRFCLSFLGAVSERRASAVLRPHPVRQVADGASGRARSAVFGGLGDGGRDAQVFEKSNYQTVKWVRYLTKAGSCQYRI